MKIFRNIQENGNSQNLTKVTVKFNKSFGDYASPTVEFLFLVKAKDFLKGIVINRKGCLDSH